MRPRPDRSPHVRDHRPAGQADRGLRLTTSRHFPEWLARSDASLVFTTYQAGKVFFLGLRHDGRLAVFERSFARCMGLGVSADARTLMLATQHQLLRFDNVLAAGARQGEHDALYAPHAGWITGDVDAHDVAIGTDGRCGLVVIDLNTGDTIEWVRIEGVVRELFDVAVPPGVKDPSALGFKTDEILRVISIEE